jgi:hypothetical protein
VLLAEDEPKKIPPLDESLKELEWLVGEWQVKPQGSALDRKNGGNDLIYRWDQTPKAPDGSTTTRLFDFAVAPGASGTSLVVSYNLLFSESVTKQAFYARFIVKESVVRDAEAGTYRGAYVCTPTVENSSPPSNGRGGYSLTRASDNCWIGKATCTYRPNAVTDPPSPDVSGTYSIELRKHDHDSFFVGLTDRVNMPHGPKDITVHFIRKQKK